MFVKYVTKEIYRSNSFAVTANFRSIPVALEDVYCGHILIQPTYLIKLFDWSKILSFRKVKLVWRKYADKDAKRDAIANTTVFSCFNQLTLHAT